MREINHPWLLKEVEVNVKLKSNPSKLLRVSDRSVGWEFFRDQ